MTCQVYQFNNGTQENIKVYNFFKVKVSNKNYTLYPSKYLNVGNQTGNLKNYENGLAEPLNVTISRTNTDEQKFSMSFSSELNYITIWENEFYHYESNNSQAYFNIYS